MIKQMKSMNITRKIQGNYFGITCITTRYRRTGKEKRKEEGGKNKNTIQLVDLTDLLQFFFGVLFSVLFIPSSFV